MRVIQEWRYNGIKYRAVFKKNPRESRVTREIYRIYSQSRTGEMCNMNI